jgi:Domain of unknown function (DUF1992)
MTDDRRNPYLPTREALIDRQIREAMEEGGWDDLPFQGERLPLVDDALAGDRALGFRMLRSAGFAPPWIEFDKEARRWVAARDTLLEGARGRGDLGRAWRRQELTRIVGEANRAIAALNVEAPSDRQHRRPLDLDAELAALDAAEREGRRS